jgi:PAS domain S-box-containing protein
LAGYVFAAAITGAAGLVLVLFTGLLADVAPYLPFVMAVVLSAWYGGRPAGLLATTLAALISMLVLVHPERAPAADQARGAIGLLLFLVSGCTIAWLSGLLHEARNRAETEREQRATSDEFHVAIAGLGSDFAFRARVEPTGTVAIDAITGGFTGLLGYTLDELTARGGWRTIIYPADLPQADAAVAALVRGELVEGELRLVAREGRAVWIRYRVRPERGAGGVVVRLYGAVQDITRLRVAEVSRHVSEERERARAEELETIMAAVPAAILIAHDPECRRITGSRIGYEMLKRMPGENMSLTAPAAERPVPFRAFRDGVELGPEDLPMQRAARGIEVRDEELEIVLADGTRRFMFGTAIPLRGHDGSSRGAVGAFVDLSDHKRAERALQESEERLRIALEAGRMGVWDWTIATGEIKWSTNLEPLHGLAPGSFGGTIEAFRQLIHPDDRTLVEQAITRALETRSTYDLEFRIVRPDGSVRWMAGKGSVLTDADGVPARMVGVGLDVTDRRRAEETVRLLLRTSTRLNSTLDLDELLDILVQEAIGLVSAESGLAGLATPDGMVCHRYFQRGAPLALEDHWPPMHGLPGWLLVHKVPYITNEAASDPQIVQVFREQFGIWSALSTPILGVQGEVLGFFEMHNKQDGSGFTAADRELLLAVSQAAAIAVQNALAYRRLEEAEQALKETDSRKEEFLATLAHELRNPLAPIRNAVEILNLQPSLTPPLAMARDVIDRQIGQMVHLVDDLMDVSRISRDQLQIRKERVALAAILENAIETSRPLIEEAGHQLTVSLAGTSIYLDADPTRMAQVISNLLNNSARYTPRGGEIWLTADREEHEVVVAVRDNGMGIAPEHLTGIFDIFSQVQPALERAAGGLGIGLSLVRKLVELHGGRVEARSEGLDRGSEFVVCLPLAAAPALERPQRAQPAAPARLDAVRILVVDDNRDAAESLATALRLRGSEVHTVYDGLEAIESCTAQRPDVVLLDIGLPRLNGYDAARRIRELPGGKDVLLVAVTGWGQDEDKRRSSAAGFDHHLVKPVAPASLEELLLAEGTRDRVPS